MAIYLGIIGAADSVFRGQYVSRESEWRASTMCKAAGFIGLLSSEVSAFSVCLITLDRFLVIRFPLSNHFHFTKRSALAACVVVWSAGMLLACVPLLLPHWQFYGQTGLCLPLPITRTSFAGQHYAFGVFIVLNLMVFLFIGACQTVIFYSIRRSAEATMKNRRQLEVVVARQLFLIVLSDFCCWFPIGVMGLLAALGVPIPGLVNVLAAVFLLPINSAVNPFLYTLAKLLERRAKKRLQKLVTRVMRHLERQLKSWPRERVEGLVQYCFEANLVDRDAFRRSMK